VTVPHLFSLSLTFFIFFSITFILYVDLGPVASWGILALGSTGTVVTLKMMSPSTKQYRSSGTGQKAKEDSWDLPMKMCGLWTSNSSAGEAILTLSCFVTWIIIHPSLLNCYCKYS
jgi:hypothetical protein